MSVWKLDAAFDDFVVAASPGLLRLAMRLTGDRQHAEDLLQVSLWKVAKRWSVASDAPFAYARRVMVNASHDRLRRKRSRLVELNGAYLPEPPSAPGPDVESRQALLEALRELPPRQRAVLVLRYWEDLSIEETAATLGCSIGTVKSTASRGLVRLRHVLDVQEALQ